MTEFEKLLLNSLDRTTGVILKRIEIIEKNIKENADNKTRRVVDFFGKHIENNSKKLTNANQEIETIREEISSIKTQLDDLNETTKKNLFMTKVGAKEVYELREHIDKEVLRGIDGYGEQTREMLEKIGAKYSINFWK